MYWNDGDGETLQGKNPPLNIFSLLTFGAIADDLYVSDTLTSWGISQSDYVTVQPPETKGHPTNIYVWKEMEICLG